MAERISDLSQFGSKLFKCARCNKWWAKSKSELLEEIGDVALRDVPVLLAKCKHAGTFSGCGVYWANNDIHVEESPPRHLRYRWLSQLEKVRATLTAQCDNGCGRVRTISHREWQRGANAMQKTAILRWPSYRAGCGASVDTGVRPWNG